MENNKKDLVRERIATFGIVLLMALTLFLLVLTVNAVKAYRYIGSNPSQPSSIVVQGTGEAIAMPEDNVGVFTFSVVEDGKSLADAQAKVMQKKDASLAVIKDAGVDDKDVTTVDYNAYPQYEDATSASTKPSICAVNGYCPPPVLNRTITGYEANLTIQVKVRNASTTADLLTRVGATGVSNVSGLDFQIDDPTKLQDEARANAIADARAKAETLAKDLGVDLDGIIGFSDNSQGPIMYAKAMATSADSAGSAPAPATSPLPQGESKVTSNVEVTYRIR